MELTVNSRVWFDETSHSYLLDDEKILVGVTTLMKKYGVGADYSGIPEAVLHKAAEEGTSIHKEIEDYFNGESVLNSELVDDCRGLRLKSVCHEDLVSEDETVASAIDGVFEKSSDSVMLVDYKSTLKVHTRALEWQLGIYKVLFERQNPSIKVDGCYCLHIDKKTRRVKDLIPITPVPESYVDDLLKAEREGESYTDPYTAESAATVLDDDLTQYSANLNLIAMLKAKLKEAETFVKECDKRLVAYMTENNLEEMSVEGGVIKIKKGYQRKTVDTARLTKDYPQLAAKYEKISEVSPSIIYKSDN